MSVLELKGEVHDMLSQVNDEKRLRKIKSFISALVSKSNGGETYPDGLTKEQYEALMATLAKSRDKANQVSLEDARQMFEQWKKR